jgi:hypothetical protein
MKELKLALIAIICFLPFVAFADHEEVLIPIFFQIISTIGFLILLSVVKAAIRTKLRFAIIYFGSLFLLVFFTKDVPYDLHRTLLDILLAEGPAIITFVAFVFLKIYKRRPKI